MNNLHILACVAALGMAAIAYQAQQIQNVLSANLDIARSLTREKVSANRQLTEFRRIETLTQLEARNADGLQDHIQKLNAANALEEEPPPGPGVEGNWPSGQPYFYLAKKNLRALSFSAVRDNVTISTTAATILGLAPAEIEGVNAAGRRLREQVQALEIQSAIPTNTPPDLNDWEGEKTTVFIRSYSPEETQEIDEEFRANLARAIGRERAELFADRVKETYSAGRYGFDEGRWLTIIESPGQVKCVQSDGAGNTMSSTHSPEDLQDGLPEPFRHLFKKF